MKIAARMSLPLAAALLAAGIAMAVAACSGGKPSAEQTSAAARAADPSAAPPAGYVYITNNGEGTVSEFSRAADGSLIFLRVARAGAANGPTGIAIDPSSRFLYVANEGDRKIHEFAIRRDTGALAPLGEVPGRFGGRPQQIAISPVGDFLYLTSFGSQSGGKTAGGAIVEYRIDRATGMLKPLGAFAGDGLRQPLGVAVAPHGRFVYVSDAAAGTLIAFAVDASGKLIAVGSTPSLGTRPGRPGLLAILPSGRFVYTVDQTTGSVVVAKPAADGALSVVKVGRVGISTARPFGIALAEIGASVFVYTGNRGSDTVSSLAVRSDGLDVVGECPTGLGYPTGMMVDPAGRDLYVVNRDSGTVAQFSLAATDGATLVPTESIFSEAPPSSTSRPLYIATTRWDAPAALAQARVPRPRAN